MLDMSPDVMFAALVTCAGTRAVASGLHPTSSGIVGVPDGWMNPSHPEKALAAFCIGPRIGIFFFFPCPPPYSSGHLWSVGIPFPAMMRFCLDERTTTHPEKRAVCGEVSIQLCDLVDQSGADDNLVWISRPGGGMMMSDELAVLSLGCARAGAPQ